MDIFIKSKLLEKNGVAHLFTTRYGGVSDGVFSSMNLSVGSGDIRDSAENVIGNHKICAEYLGFSVYDLCKTNQEHTKTIETVTRENRGMGVFTPAFKHGVDGLVTKDTNVVLCVRGADCGTLLAADMKNGVIGCAHSGWRGTLDNISHELIRKMTELGASPDCITVAVGPCIKGCCYEVGGEIFEAFSQKSLGFAFEKSKNSGKYMLDIAKVIKHQLINEGVLEDSVDVIDHCTCCNDDFFSHRRMGINRGTGGGIIGMREFVNE